MAHLYKKQNVFLKILYIQIFQIEFYLFFFKIKSHNFSLWLYYSMRIDKLNSLKRLNYLNHN